MHTIAEVFLESDFDSCQTARQQRDARFAELQAQGYDCQVDNLYTIHTGLQIFIVVARPPLETIALVIETEEKAGSHSQLPPVQRPRPKVKLKARSPKTGKLEYEDRSRFRAGD